MKKLLLSSLISITALMGAANAGSIMVHNDTAGIPGSIWQDDRSGRHALAPHHNWELRNWGTNCINVQPHVINYGVSNFCAPEEGTLHVHLKGSLFGMWYETNHDPYDIGDSPYGPGKGTKALYGNG